MTQEELDAMMGGDVALDEVSDESVIEKDSSQKSTDEAVDAAAIDVPSQEQSEEVAVQEEVVQEEVVQEEVVQEEVVQEEEAPTEAPEASVPSDIPEVSDAPIPTEEPTATESDSAAKEETSFSLPPATDKNQVVGQLDDVTRDSELKATEIFEKLEKLSDMATKIEDDMMEQEKLIQNNIDIFERLSAQFTSIDSFATALEENKTLLANMQESLEQAQGAGNEVMMIMDVMQYQDIHRQKIERVINVMRELSKYMNHLFASKVDDSQRTSSAVYIEGDGMEVMAEGDIEALIASFGEK